MQKMKHAFLECTVKTPECNCLECTGILYCTTCCCMDDELLSSCPGFMLDHDSAREIADRKVVDIEEFKLRRLRLDSIGFVKSQESEYDVLSEMQE